MANNNTVSGQIDKARKAATRDGRLRFVTIEGKIGFRVQLDGFAVGANDWAEIRNGNWTYKKFAS